MTATMTSSFLGASFTYESSQLFTVDVFDYDNQVESYEVEAHSEDEAKCIALDLATYDGIDVDYICVYVY